MSYVPQLPDPVAYKVSGWGLPAQVELAFYEQVAALLESLPKRQYTEVITCEFSVGDGPERSFIFYGRLGARLYKDAFVITFCDFEYSVQDDGSE